MLTRQWEEEEQRFPFCMELRYHLSLQQSIRKTAEDTACTSSTSTSKQSHKQCVHLYCLGSFISFTDATVRDINYVLIALLSGELKWPLHYDCCCICLSYLLPPKQRSKSPLRWTNWAIKEIGLSQLCTNINIERQRQWVHKKTTTSPYARL